MGKYKVKGVNGVEVILEADNTNHAIEEAQEEYGLTQIKSVDVYCEKTRKTKTKSYFEA